MNQRYKEAAEQPSRRTHRISVRVYYEDTDAAGMVYHANYLRFAERGRTEMLRACGFGQRRLREEAGIGFAVCRATVDYRLPARLDDELTVETGVVGLGAATIELRQTIRRGDEIVAILEIIVACIGRDGRPRRLPGELRVAFNQPCSTTLLSK